ncbi:alpha/beta fold hydrolase [Blastococcus saxobsidens]|uniref:Pimeloyl-ACP methyl ester carboxylesterase n=1 Tax=Blastococcus saxobsidens TaxID=138336 RepID=A0A4Q7Y519_9ACTN|nr:alpha/beta hydrolase [Blastococcus saxobsidens]RZU31005.1 pimeloyl-ACP methyl ester carboxylesterase [Blastococcus saxobsidens]
MNSSVTGSSELTYSLRGEGSPLLLVAGTGYPGSTWHLPDFIDELAGHHTVITFDHRGTGGTPGGDEPFTTRSFAADACALLRTLDLGPAHVVGHSMGGRVGQWMALDAPELVRSLVLAASGSGGSGNPDQPAGLPIGAMTAMIERGYRGYMETHIEATFFTPEYAAEHPDRVRWLVDAFWEHRPTVESYLRHVSARQNHDTSGLLGDIGVPSLVLIGDKDLRRGPTGSHVDQSRFLHAHIPGATLNLLPGLSHGMFWQAPEVVVDALVSWTRQLEGSGPFRSTSPTTGRAGGIEQ